MPNSLPSYCTEPGCGAIVKGGRCSRHVRFRNRSAAYGSEWRRIAKQVLEEQPYCANHPDRFSTQVDHVVSSRKGGTDDRSNLVGLCAPCHSRKTASQDGGFGNPPR